MTAFLVASCLVVTLLTAAPSSGSSLNEESPTRSLTDTQLPFPLLGHGRQMLQGSALAGSGAGAGDAVGAGAGADASIISGPSGNAAEEVLRGGPTGARPFNSLGVTGSSRPGTGMGADCGDQTSSDSPAEAEINDKGAETEAGEAALRAPDSGDSSNQAAASIAGADSSDTSVTSGDEGLIKLPHVAQRQPELFQGVTLDEYNALRDSGKIDAYGFSTSNGPLSIAAASHDEAAAGPETPAAAPESSATIQREAEDIVSLSSGFVDPLG